MVWKNKIQKFDEEKITISIGISSFNLKFITVEEATKVIMTDFLLEWKEGIERNDNRKFLGNLGNIFSKFCNLWYEDLNYITEFKQYIKIKDVIPFLNPWNSKKYHDRKPGTNKREHYIKNFINPLDKNNEFWATIYYPFPIISCLIDHNHTLLAMYEEAQINVDCSNTIIRTNEIIFVNKIIANISFKKNKLIL